MRVARSIGWTMTLVALAAAAGAATPPAPPPRPKVGLALSGGGARGLAHLGVLQWLEEHRVPVDVIAGTSMGGLVGGIYAMGLEADEARELVHGLDWDVIFRVRPPYEQLSYRRKEDQRTFANEIEMGVKKGIKLPPGVNQGMEIGLLLDRLTLPYHDLESFSDLPIPFRCVGTDMERAEEVILGDGSLSLALRATMSIPGAFAPVEVGGKLLADGGLLDNLPVEVARGMGAEVVIAVDVGTPLGDREQIENIFGSVNQMIGVMMSGSIRRNRQLAHVVVTPDLEGYSNSAFRQVDPIVDRGYQAAEANAAALLRFALDEPEWSAHIAARRARRRRDVPAASRIAVDRLTGPVADALTHRFASLVGQPPDSARLDHGLREVVGEGRLANVGYGLMTDAGGTVLVIRPLEKNYAPPLLKIGLSLSNARPDTVEFGVFARITFLDFGGDRAEWRSDMSLGSRDGLASEYYRPLLSSRFFVAPGGSLATGTIDIYQGDRRVGEYSVKRSRLGIDLGYAIGRTAELRFGYGIGHVDAEVTVGDPLLPDVSGKESLVRARWVVDRQGSAVIPTHGLRLSGEAAWLFDGPGAPQSYPRLEGDLSWFFPAGAKGSIFTTAAGGTTFDRDPGPDKFTLGGPARLSAFGPAQFRGDNYVYASAGYLHRIARLPLFLGGNVYCVGFLEAGSAFEGAIEEARFETSLSGGIMAETNFSALFLGGAVSDDGDSNWFLSLGRRF